VALQEPRYPDKPKKRNGNQTIRSLLIGEKPIDVEVVYCYYLRRSDNRTAFEIPPEYKEFGELFEEEAPN
jgi:hypothetical protein